MVTPLKESERSAKQSSSLKHREGRVGLRHVKNVLNDLPSNEWLMFQKSWFVLNPKPREKNVLQHPAKFPEELVKSFIGFFTKRGGVVLDPMVGTGSALVAALECGRSAVGIELQRKYAEIAIRRCDEVIKRANTTWIKNGRPAKNVPYFLIIFDDARNLDEFRLPVVDYCITSPPYWDMLRAKGFETQLKRKLSGFDVHYSDDPRDAGNIADYDEFIDFICGIYEKVLVKLKKGGYLTVIVKNIKKGGKIYPLAWDIAKRLNGPYVLKDEKIWCQDNQKLAPYGFGHAWVSNTMHHYCLNFRKE